MADNRLTISRDTLETHLLEFGRTRYILGHDDNNIFITIELFQQTAMPFFVTKVDGWIDG